MYTNKQGIVRSEGNFILLNLQYVSRTYGYDLDEKISKKYLENTEIVKMLSFILAIQFQILS